MRRSGSAIVLAGVLAVTGTLHFVIPESYDGIVPRVLPADPRLWTYLSGFAELAVAVAVAVPRTRRAGGLAAAALFVALLPANVQMALDWGDRETPYQIAAWTRVVLQVPLILWGLQVSRST